MAEDVMRWLFGVVFGLLVNIALYASLSYVLMGDWRVGLLIAFAVADIERKVGAYGRRGSAG